MALPVKKREYNVVYTPQRLGYYKRTPLRHKRHKKNFFKIILNIIFLGLYSYYVCPYIFENYLRPLYVNRFLNRNIELNLKEYVNPTLNYIHNTSVLNQYLIAKQNSNKLDKIKIINELTSAKVRLLRLFRQYPHLSPAVFVWEYSTGYGLEINADTIYPTASIIKIPIAAELMRLIDKSSKTSIPIKLDDKKLFSELYRTEGSGNLQKTSSNVSYTLDYLASIMISDSDNSATNMILDEIGGIDGFNRSMRNLGMRVTSMSNWLPDLEGTNRTTAREISQILYNIDNPNYINPVYKTVLKEYLGNVKNVHLLKEKLPPDVMVLHKTGDIGSMLGDCGIVYTNNAKRYVISVLVKRPYNDYSARTLIQEISAIVFDEISKL